jgi:hypothetical protein
MADKGYIKTLLAPVADATTRRAVQQCFEYLMDNISLGTPEHQRRATNVRQYWMASTTTTSTGEFTIVHGLGVTPRYAIPVVDISQPGAGLVPLVVTRAADSARIYLKSTSTSTPIVLLVEG